MTDVEFESAFKIKVAEERKITGEILSLINEAEARRIHLQRGYSSLFTWLVHLGYSESAAYRRIEAARQIRAVPEVAEKLQSGELNLTTLTKARTAMKAHQKKTGRKLSNLEQAEVIRQIEKRTSKEADQKLFELFPDQVPREHQSVVSETLTRLAFNLDPAAMADLEWVGDFLSHAIPDGDTAKIFAKLLREFREKATAAAAKPRVKPSKSSARRISLHRAERKCEFRDPVTGRICGATYQIQSDHRVPKAFGGSDDLKNRRCLCAAHNRLGAEQKLGSRWANSWRES